MPHPTYLAVRLYLSSYTPSWSTHSLGHKGDLRTRFSGALVLQGVAAGQGGVSLRRLQTTLSEEALVTCSPKTGPLIIGVLPGESRRTACVEAGLRTSRSSGCCERQTQELQRAICAVAMGSHPRPSTTGSAIGRKRDKGKCRACARARLAPARHQFINDRRDQGILASDSQSS